MKTTSSISRRRWMIGTGLFVSVAAISVVSGSLPTRAMAGRFGFTVSSPKAGLQEFVRDVREVKALGAAWVRFPVVGFQIVRSWSVEGRVDFDPERLKIYDKAIAFVESMGMSICLLTVDGAPATRNTPQYLTTMKQYWGLLAQRYGSSVAVWQVYNEVSDIDFRTAAGIKGSREAYYSDLDEALGVARAAIHQHAAHVRITTSASGYPVDDEKEKEWLRFFAAVSGHLDICTIDLYPVLSAPAIKSLPDRIERLEKAQGMAVSVGEFGLQTGLGRYTENQQVESLTKTIGELSRTRADPVFVYRLRDDGAYQDDGFGLFNIDGTPKSSVSDVAAAIAHYYPNG